MICDKYDGFELSDEVLEEHYFNEFGTLSILFLGLDWLYRYVKQIEDVAISRIGKRGFAFNNPCLADLPLPIVECCFHWYAVSICNFVKLIGWIGYKEQKSIKNPHEYVKSVLPEVLIWRNKIAAHFARTFLEDDKRDNIVEKEASVIIQLGEGVRELKCYNALNNQRLRVMLAQAFKFDVSPYC